MTRRVGVERTIRKELQAYFGPEGTDDDDLDALFMRLLSRELAKERARAFKECEAIALAEEEPEGDPPPYIQRRMAQSTIIDNVHAAIRATKKGIAGAIREAALSGRKGTRG